MTLFKARNLGVSALVATAIALATVAVTPASAALVKLTYEGTVTTVLADEIGQVGAAGIIVGTKFSGQIQYDTSVAPTAVSPTGTVADYPTVSNDVTFDTAGGDVVVESSSSNVLVFNQSSFDALIFFGSAPTSAGLSYPTDYLFTISLRDSSATVFDSADLPTALSLSSFDQVAFDFDAETLAGDEDAFTGTLTSLTLEVSAVPVPAALPLFLSGLLGLGVMARRRKQKAA